MRKAIAGVMPSAHRVFEEFSRQLGSRAFIACDAFSLADVMLAPQRDLFRGTPEWQALTASHMNLKAWLDRVNERPSLQATTWERVAALATAR
jgi:glutathione S-transferase